MIRGRQGVAVTSQQGRTEFGIEVTAFELRWLTEPGHLTLELEVPTLCMMATEIGGRCDFRAEPDQPAYGEYFGPGTLAFAAPGSRVAIHAAEMREARLCCFALHGTGADYLTPEDITAVRLFKSRHMFRNERIRTCAMLLDTGRLGGDTTAYILSLSKALFAAVLEMGKDFHQRSKAAGLIGASWDAISRHIRDHLGEPITVETLAEIAQMPPERFGAAFRDVTGMSIRQWHMDYRVRSAQRLLADDPNENLSEVALLCGFADQSHFTRAFLKVVGLTPTAWLHSRT